MDIFNTFEIAVIIPCFNEETTIGSVVDDFKQNLQDSNIYVYDNNSIDATNRVAKESGAIVRLETKQGKGNVVRRAFADIDADLYILVDGDGTYTAADAPQMIQKLLSNHFDYINGVRVQKSNKAYRLGHKFGNTLLTGIVSFVFKSQIRDMLSGYKIFSRRFVKSFPAISSGFEIETEIAVHALRLRLPMGEFLTNYQDRPDGSFSKLGTIKDGIKILFAIIKLIETERPILFWTIIASVVGIISIIFGVPIIITYFDLGIVPRFPTAFFCGFLGIISIFSLFTGIILDLVQKSRDEVKRLFYLSIPFMRDRQK